MKDKDYSSPVFVISKVWNSIGQKSAMVVPIPGVQTKRYDVKKIDTELGMHLTVVSLIALFSFVCMNLFLLQF